MQVGIADLKAHLSEYLARVQEGEEIIVADRGRPVARLIPPTAQRGEMEDVRLLDLQRRGLVRVGTGRIREEFWVLNRPHDDEATVRSALEAERAAGR